MFRVYLSAESIFLKYIIDVPFNQPKIIDTVNLLEEFYDVLCDQPNSAGLLGCAFIRGVFNGFRHPNDGIQFLIAAPISFFQIHWLSPV
ncbi:MAG TPA: hypothetical protein VF297_10605 [Pyrinomonadaceae bacterium]